MNSKTISITHNNPKEIIDFIITISSMIFERNRSVNKLNWKLNGNTNLMYKIKQRLPMYKFSKGVYLEYRDKKAIVVARKIVFVKRDKLDIYPSVH